MELRILHVEDREDDLLLINRFLAKSNITATHTRVDSAEDMAEQLERGEWDLIISDYAMPAFDAFAALNIAQKYNFTGPFIVVSGTIGDELAVELMHRGAHDYIMKDNLKRLPAAIKREMREAHLRKEMILAEEKLITNEKKFRTLTENSHDFILRLNLDGEIIFANKKLQKRLKSELMPLEGKHLSSVSYLIDVSKYNEMINEILKTGKVVRKELCSHNGNWYDWLIAPEYNEKNQISTVMAVGRDITESKNNEAKLRYISYHDPLTGLNNRIYAEKIMQEIKSDNKYPVGVIICDIDGLKMINDSLGHNMGDQLLRATADILHNSLQDALVISRMGGDEFIAIIQAVNYQDFTEKIDLIYYNIEEYNENNIKLPISLSVGFKWTNGDVDVEQAYREADNQMYRGKLHKAQSVRSGIVQLLVKALEARDFETERHMERMESIALEMGKNFKLPEDRLSALRLFARFHDIGKVGIPDEILFKKDALTGQEYAIMKTHSDIGHRMARSASELKHIADFILYHHEWWDGRGYPRGIKGEEIPLESRILAVVDAYDAMVCERPYSKPLPVEVAIEELIRQKGTQFDPEVVDKFLEIKNR